MPSKSYNIGASKSSEAPTATRPHANNPFFTGIRRYNMAARFGQPGDDSKQAGVPGLLQNLISVVRENINSITNLAIVVIILSLETVFDQALFNCPCNSSSFTYGVLFIFAPCVALFVLGILVNNTTWYLVTGCWRRARDTSHGLKLGSYFCFGILFRALVAPLAWVFFAFLDGRYYMCAVSLDPCGTSTEANTRNAEIRAQSQLIGWSILTVTVVVALTALLGWRSCQRLTFEQDKYVQIYRKMEKMEIERQFEEHAHNIAQQNVAHFLRKDKREKRDWDEISRVPTLSSQKDGVRELTCTPLHKLAERDRTETTELNDNVIHSIFTQTDTAVEVQTPGVDMPDLNPRLGEYFIQITEEQTKYK